MDRLTPDSFRLPINANGTITMAALWPGDSGTATFVIENNDYLTTIETSNNDLEPSRNWACIWNSPSQITLNRHWGGPTETGACAYSYVLAGFRITTFHAGRPHHGDEVRLTNRRPGDLDRLCGARHRGREVDPEHRVRPGYPGPALRTDHGGLRAGNGSASRFQFQWADARLQLRFERGFHAGRTRTHGGRFAGAAGLLRIQPDSGGQSVG